MAALLRVAVSRAVSASRRSTGLYLYKKIVRTVNQNASVLVCRPISTSLNFREKVIPFILPDIGEGIKEVQVLEWFVKEGDKVAEFDDICEVQSDKAAVKITSRYDGVVKKIHYDVDTIATVGAPLVDISVEGDGDATPTHDQQSTTPTPTPKQQKDSSTPAAGKVLATPAVRRIAAENNINLATVPATGKDGRVLKEDILLYIEKLKAPATPVPQPTPSVDVPVAPAHTLTTPTPPIAAPERILFTADREEPIKGFKRTMVKTMTQSGNIPQFGYCDEIEMTELVRLRLAVKDIYSIRGISLSYMPFIVKAVSMSLHYFPVLNSHVDEACTVVTTKASHNIGVAMDTKDGLIVPNIKDVQNKSVVEIAAEMQQLMQLGSSGQLGPSDLTGGTFSLSNIGAIGGTYARPLLLPPEVAIGALGKISVLPRFDNEGEVVPAHIMQVSWSADHRVIDGATVARFSNMFKSYIENPGCMVMEMK
jgi:2-oxoisovalerate dehydrogenase E2 component (dihydrolipoyl transacylase)